MGITEGEKHPIVSMTVVIGIIVVIVLLCAAAIYLLQPKENEIEVVVEKNAINVIFGEGVVSPPKLSPGDNFVVSLKCAMIEPVKGFEAKVSFNPDVLQVVDVSRGSIFLNYADFFNNGTIDNTNGTLINLFNLIVGPGPYNMTSNPGSLAKITFVAIAPGVSQINIYDVGITNETGYLPVTLTNSSVVVYDD